MQTQETITSIESYRATLRAVFYSLTFLIAMLLSFHGKLVAQTAECPAQTNVGTIPTSRPIITMIEGYTETYSVRICPSDLEIPEEGIIATIEVTPTEQLKVEPAVGLSFYSDARILTVTVYAIPDKIPEPDTIVVIRHMSGTETLGYVSSGVTVTVKDGFVSYLPSIHKAVKWERVSASGEEIDVLALQPQKLFAGHRVKTSTNIGGGVYVTDKCQPSGDFKLLAPSLSKVDVRDLYFEGNRTVIGTFGDSVFFSKDGGFAKASGITNPYVYATLFSDAATSYAGADNGLYRGDSAGANWSRVFASMTDLNTIRVLRLETTGSGAKILWIGTTNGLWQLSLPNGTPTKDVPQALGTDAQNIRDILFNDSKIFLATADGVYQRDSNTSWKPIGAKLRGKSTLSLEKHNNKIYAGLNEQDVYVYEEKFSDWTPTGLLVGSTRDLVSDSTLCKGLVAATADGIWVLR